VHNALGDLYRYEGEFERAYEHTEAYAQVSEQMGVRISSRIALSNQAQVCIGMGRLDEAEAYIERLEDEFEDRGVDSATSIYIRVLRLTLAAARERWDALRERLEPYLERWPHEIGPERDHRWMLERATEFARTGAPPELIAQLEAVSQRLGGADG
jgi:tetratricopeptide (TPR) repeat protein